MYQDMVPLLDSSAVDLLDHDWLMMQLVSLERTNAGGGRDKIDHQKPHQISLLLSYGVLCDRFATVVPFLIVRQLSAISELEPCGQCSAC